MSVGFRYTSRVLRLASQDIGKVRVKGPQDNI